MQYKLIYRPYDLSRLIEQARGEKGTSYGTQEAGDWNDALNKFAKDGWKIRDSGAITSGKEVIFWALFEKEALKSKVVTSSQNRT